MSSAIKPIPLEDHGGRLAAIVLAAGYSSRMVDFKPMLPIAGTTAFERCITLFRAAGITDVIAVLGHRASELQPVAERFGTRCVLNPRFDQGMFSSIEAGSRALPQCVDAAFVLPADIPLVRPATVRQLAAAWASHPAGILDPTFEGRRGHPPLIARQILDEATRDGADGPLSALLARHESNSIEVPVADEAIHLDMDTPADYEALVSLAMQRDVPSVAECEAILVGQHVAQFVVRHSRKVAEVALQLAHALHHTDVSLNIGLVQAGALLHDVAKGRPDHAAAGATLLRIMSFPRVAEIVGAHTDLDFSSRLDESALVYLADKLVRGEKLVTISERFQPALDQFSNDPLALQAARKRKEMALRVARAVETRLGAPIANVLNENTERTDQPANASVFHEVLIA